MFSRVTSREAGFGVVPLENSQAGSVNETYDLLQHTSMLRIVGEALVRVDHALLGVPGARLRRCKRARSHWQALAQCEEFLSSMRIEPVPVHDTAGAARMIAERARAARTRPSRASRPGLNLGLAVLAERIQTEKENFTKFAAIGIEQVDLGRADKTSLVMAVLDHPGSLLASLQPFAERGINLHKLESRPRRGKAFEYVFYVDLMAAADDPDVEAALAEVAQHTSLLRVLGSLPIGRRPGLTMADRFESPGRPAQPSVAVGARRRGRTRRGHRGRHRSGDAGDEGERSEASQGAAAAVKTPPPINTAIEGLTTFRGNASRSYYGEGPVPLDPVIRWQSTRRREAVLGLDRRRRIRANGAAPAGRASRT